MGATLDLMPTEGLDKGEALPAIYQVEGDTLTTAMSSVRSTKGGTGPRPNTFEGKEKGEEVTTFKRAK